jgi:hypothetical protein
MLSIGFMKLRNLPLELIRLPALQAVRRHGPRKPTPIRISLTT